MPARSSRPARKMPALVENDGTDTRFPLDQPSNMVDSQPNNSMDNVSNTSETEMAQEFEDANQQDEQEENVNNRRKRKRYHRHTQLQIQELEAFFKECPHPDDKQRKDLSRALELEPLQIKFWFQNKRTQMKNHHERHENTHLRVENEKLKSEMLRYKEALGNALCPSCGGQRVHMNGEMSYDERQLRLENARLKEEIERISSTAGKYAGKSLFPNNLHNVDFIGIDLPQYSTPCGVDGEGYNNGDIGFEDVPIMMHGPISEVEKPFIIELVLASMEEFVQMAHLQEPLWFPSMDNGTSLLNVEEYFRSFPRGIGPRPIGFSTEATRETTIVIMSHGNLVEILMDVKHWASMFSGIVSRASTIDVLSTGSVAGNFNGAIQVILAETQLASPQVPTRECYFARYCKQRVDGTWAIVDVSLDHLRHGGPPTRSRKRPSGCIIQEMPNGYSKVTWVEHVEVDDSGIRHIYKPLVSSGLAFGAKRWLATLDRQCQRLVSAVATPIPTNDFSNMVLSTQESRSSMLKLSERMVNSFTSGVSASAGNNWTTLTTGNGTDEMVRVMTRKSVNDPGRPPGIVLSAATSFWLPISPKIVFDFLRDENTRNEWDILSNGGMVQEMAHIVNGIETGNCASLLRVNSDNASQSNMLILQESITDPTGSYVIYAPVDVNAMNIVLNGGDPDFVPLLPSGFAILPDGPPGVIGARGTYNNSPGGSLLTVAFQILVDYVPTAKISLGSVATVNNLIACTIDKIKGALLPKP